MIRFFRNLRLFHIIINKMFVNRLLSLLLKILSPFVISRSVYSNVIMKHHQNNNNNNVSRFAMRHTSSSAPESLPPPNAPLRPPIAFDSGRLRRFRAVTAYCARRFSTRIKLAPEHVVPHSNRLKSKRKQEGGGLSVRLFWLLCFAREKLDEDEEDEW